MHKCDKMPTHIPSDLSFIKHYYGSDDKKTIYYCHYCGCQLNVEVSEEEGK